jgi:hypothetical protein
MNRFKSFFSIQNSDRRTHFGALGAAFLITALCTPTRARTYAPAATSLPPWVIVSQNRYALKDSSVKLVDNYGNGFEDLYGTRNFRAVLFGVLYRGGANNYYHRAHPRSNRNPLPDDGLKNLCQEGFSNAVYLYPNNFGSATPTVGCTKVAGGAGSLEYTQMSTYNEKSIRKILDLAFLAMNGGTSGPIYLHCWNGWHASGLISALALKQFCGWDGKHAVRYWEQNTDGSYKSPSFDNLKKEILNFKPYKDLLISQDWQDQVCPP